MKRIWCLGFVLMVLSVVCFGEITVPNKGPYATIDTKADTDLINRLKSQTKATRDRAVAELKSDLDGHSPIALCVGGDTMFKDGDQFEGLKLYLIGRIRITYDILRCTDSTVGDTRDVVDQTYVPDFIDFIRSNGEDYQRAENEALEYFENHEEKYDQRWINLHGMAAMSEGLGNGRTEGPLSKPETSWPEIKRDVIGQFREAASQAN